MAIHDNPKKAIKATLIMFGALRLGPYSIGEISDLTGYNYNKVRYYVKAFKELKELFEVKTIQTWPRKYVIEE